MIEFYKKNLREVYGETLVELGEKYENVVVLDADLCTSTATYLFRDRFPKRFYQCGIAEANMFGAAAGLAERGFMVFPSTFASFAARRALDSIYMHVALHNAEVKIPGSYPGLTATECGPSHNSCDDIGIFTAMPNMRVVDAGDNRELRAAMHVFAETKGPVYFRIPKANMPVLFDDSYSFEWGKGYLLKDGSDVAILSTGMMTGIALKGAQILKEKGVSARVVHMPSIKPIDQALVIESAKKTGAILTLENGHAVGGFGACVQDVVCNQAPVFVEQMGVSPDVFPQSDNLYGLLHAHALTPADVAKRAQALLKKVKG